MIDFIFITSGQDWANFVFAIQAFIRGQNPYTIVTNYNGVYEPIWTYLILSPLAILPFRVGRILSMIIGFICFAITARKMGASKWQSILFLLSAPVVGCLYDGNVDWLVTLGLWMPPQLGIFFVLMKPQIGACIALFWTYKIFKEGGIQSTVKFIYPVLICYILSIALYGNWILKMVSMPSNPANIGFFPYLVPFGILLLYKSLKNNNQNLSIISAPMIAPYLTMYNMSSIFLGLFNEPEIFLAFWVASWIPSIIRLFHA